MSSSFPRFHHRYRVTARQAGPAGIQIVTSALERTRGYEELMGEYAGATFKQGLYRLHALDRRAQWNALVAEAFPGHSGHFATFAYDWMGRQFALDARRSENGEPLILLFDPGFGEALEIPATFLTFHENELVEHADAALADSVFEEWLQSGHPGPGPQECVGYKISPVLGGLDRLENNQLSDLEVYWSLSSQILAQTRAVKAGTPIGKVHVD